MIFFPSYVLAMTFSATLPAFLLAHFCGSRQLPVESLAEFNYF